MSTAVLSGLKAFKLNFDLRVRWTKFQETVHYIEPHLEHRRTRTFQEEYLAFLKKHGARFDEEIPLGIAAPDHTVPYGTVLPGTLSPGTSCQATIVLSLRDALADISQQHPAKPVG
jgi:hypothetical protein